MNPVELDRTLRKVRLSGVADVLETRLRQAQSEKLVAIDLVSAPVSDELQRRQDRLFARHTKKARFRDPDRSFDTFDFDFNKKMNRALVYELATTRFIGQREDALFLPELARATSPRPSAGAPSSRGYRVLCRKAHTLIEEIADATIDGTRKEYLTELATVPLLIVDDLGMRKLPHTATEDLLELAMRRYERASTISPRTARSTTGGSSSGTPRLLPHSSTAFPTTPTSSSADPGAGGPSSTPTCLSSRPRGRPPPSLRRYRAGNGRS